MSDPKKPDETKKDAATAEEKTAELSEDELDQVAGGVISVGNLGAAVGVAGKTTVAGAPKIAVVGFDPNIIPKGGTSE